MQKIKTFLGIKWTNVIKTYQNLVPIQPVCFQPSDTFLLFQFPHFSPSISCSFNSLSEKGRPLLVQTNKHKALHLCDIWTVSEKARRQDLNHLSQRTHLIQQLFFKAKLSLVYFEQCNSQANFISAVDVPVRS